MNANRVGTPLLTLLIILLHCATVHADRPNILFAISDDQSFPHASAYGCRWVKTPGFDRVAREGVLFTNSFSPTPGCSPTRAALLTGRHAWQIEHAGTHASSFAAKYVTFPDLLEKAGYFVGYTGKGWGPGNFRAGGRTRNPAGPQVSGARMRPPVKGVSSTDYVSNFTDFLEKRPKGAPFCFWYGAHEPHRGFDKEGWKAAGKSLADAEVPAFLPDTPTVRKDLLSYAVEIEWSDMHLIRMLKELEAAGELRNTLVIVTSDNGMAFPRAKANVYEYGVHMPLAICWPARVPGGRKLDDLVNGVDLTATILDAAGVKHPQTFGPQPGRSLLPLLVTKKTGRGDPTRDAAFVARERHSSSRFRSLGYPQRAIRTHEFLYIRNLRPERWPAGAPRKFGAGGYPSKAAVKGRQLGPEHGGYHDIDACPTLTELIARRADPAVKKFFHLAVDKRPAEELYDVRKDPGCVQNLAGNPAYRKERDKLRARLDAYLKKTSDPRAHGRRDGDIFETYPRYSRLRAFPVPDWAKKNPVWVPKQEWLVERWKGVGWPP